MYARPVLMPSFSNSGEVETRRTSFKMLFKCSRVRELYRVYSYVRYVVSQEADDELLFYQRGKVICLPPNTSWSKYSRACMSVHGILTAD